MTYFRVSRGFKSGGFNGTAQRSRIVRDGLPTRRSCCSTKRASSRSGSTTGCASMPTGSTATTPTSRSASSAPVRPPGVVDSSKNAGNRQRSGGVEVEVTAIPLRGVEATATYGFLAPKFTEWLDQKFDANGQPDIRRQRQAGSRERGEPARPSRSLPRTSSRWGSPTRHRRPATARFRRTSIRIGRTESCSSSTTATPVPRP